MKPYTLVRVGHGEHKHKDLVVRLQTSRAALLRLIETNEQALSYEIGVQLVPVPLLITLHTSRKLQPGWSLPLKHVEEADDCKRLHRTTSIVDFR